MNYAFPQGGLPGQDQDPDGAAVLTQAYAVIPASVQRDIVTSLLPGWESTRAWILARPLTGFAETFAQYAVEVEPGGGSSAPDPDPGAEAVIFVAQGHGRLSIGGKAHDLAPGSYAYLPPDTDWSVINLSDLPLRFHWIRKRYQPLAGVPAPQALVTTDFATAPSPMPNTDRWATTRFVDPGDIAHDMHVNIVTFQPGARIPFAECHVMEHGIYVLEGTARYLLNTDWVAVGPGDFLWLRAFCPQACIATGDGPFRYLLYKDVHRHPDLVLP